MTNALGTIGLMKEFTPRQILARNLTKLIEAATPHGSRPSRRAWALAKGLDVKLIDRLCKGEHAVTIDKLAEIAEACGLQPWHLLLDDFDPREPAPDAPLTDAERKLLQRLRHLSER